MSIKVDEIDRIIDMENTMMRLNGKTELLYRLLGVMKDNYNRSYEEISILVNENRLEEAKELVHTIKGAAGNLGILVLYEAASNLEYVIKEGVKKEIITQLENYRISIDKTLKKL